MREIKTVIVELEYPRDDCLRDCSDEYYGIGRELIRCKECRYYRWESDMCDYPYATAQNVVHEDDFCSKAERRTDE